MLEIKDFINIGYIAKTHGVKGEIQVAIKSNFDIENVDFSFILLLQDGGLVPYEVIDYRIKGINNIIFKLLLIDTEEQAKNVVGIEAYISYDDFIVQDKSSYNLLIGYSVVNQDDKIIGELTDIQDIAGNSLFIVEKNKQEILIPINADYNIQVDDDNKIIHIDIPEGLLDINL